MHCASDASRGAKFTRIPIESARYRLAMIDAVASRGGMLAMDLSTHIDAAREDSISDAGREIAVGEGRGLR
jgi:hypothetical protein